ncbi:MAG: helix-turn-helix domain-containing protein [Streptosporangiales bacterium]|nr:helix-turn-helix domain-containing protein [Streptosporangiales bacterium]
MAGFTDGRSRTDDSVLVVEKTRLILDCFSPHRPVLAAAEIRRATGLPSTTCTRLLRALVHEDILARDRDRFRIGARVFGWAASAMGGPELTSEAGPVVRDLRDASGETSCLFVRRGPARICVAVAESTRAVIHRLKVGQVRPLHAGASGKVFMAYDGEAFREAIRSGLARFTPNAATDRSVLEDQLKAIRELGYAAAHEEREAGLSSLAAPVFGPDGTLVAVIVVGAPAFRLLADDVPRIAPLVMRSAATLSARLGYDARGTPDERDT